MLCATSSTMPADHFRRLGHALSGCPGNGLKVFSVNKVGVVMDPEVVGSCAQSHG